MWLCHVSWSLGQLQLLGRVHLIGPTWFSGPPLIEQHGLLAVVLLCGKPFQSARDWNDDWKRVQPNLFKVKEKCNRTQSLAQSLVFHVCLFVLCRPPPRPNPDVVCYTVGCLKERVMEFSSRRFESRTHRERLGRGAHLRVHSSVSRSSADSQCPLTSSFTAKAMLHLFLPGVLFQQLTSAGYEFLEHKALVTICPHPFHSPSTKIYLMY